MEQLWEVITLPGKSHGDTVVYPLVAVKVNGNSVGWQADVEPLALVVDNCGFVSTYLIESIRKIDAQPAG